MSARRFVFPLLTSAALAAMSATSNGCGGEVDPVPLGVEVPPPQAPPARDAGTRSPGDGRAPAARPPLPPLTTATEVDLGMVDSGATVTVAVPPNALGFNVVVSGEDTDEVGVRALVSPTGEAVLRDHIVVGGTFETALGRGIAAASVPQNQAGSAMPITPGAWAVTVSSQMGRPVHVRARIQISGDGAFHGGALDMHVYLPTGLKIEDPDNLHVVSAATAPTDASIEARLTSFYLALEAVTGLVRGTVTFHDASAGFVKISTETALASGFAVSKGNVTDGEQSIHVLLTNDLDFGEGTWGIASGIPGAATRTGTRASGVALAISEGTLADMDGLALLHEVGHFVGLNHTTEIVGGFVDALTDTPNCAGTLDIERPETLDRCADKDNLMFPTLWSPAVRMSASQRLIFRGSPTYRAFVGPTPLPEAGAGEGGIDGGTSIPDAAFAPSPGAPSREIHARFTHSGRALTASERFVLGGLCGSTAGRAGLGAAGLRARLGPSVAHAELTRIANDADLAGVIRMRARKMLAAP